MKKEIFLLSCLIINAVSQVRYDNFTLFEVTPLTSQQETFLKQVEDTFKGIYWSFYPCVNNTKCYLTLPPETLTNFKQIVNKINLKHEIISENLQELIEKQNTGRYVRDTDENWKKYQNLDEIYKWLKQKEVDFPQVKLIKEYKSYEGNDVIGVHLTYHPNNANRAIFLEGAIHGRDWLSAAVITYILHALLYSDDKDVRYIAERYDWYLFPVVNPDSYAYTHSPSGDRLWRKTRKPYGICRGVDLNRNWNYHWMEGGSDSNPCSDIYAGPKAFSEIEASGLSKYIESITKKLLAYVAFDSYSQQILIPFGFKGAQKPDNYNTMYEIALEMQKGFKKRYGSEFSVGNMIVEGYIASGTSVDWVNGNQKVGLTYTINLRDKGKYGFLLPATEIIPSALETLDALVEMIKALENQ